MSTRKKKAAPMSEEVKQIESAAEAEQIADMLALAGGAETEAAQSEAPGDVLAEPAKVEVLCIWRSYKPSGEEVMQVTRTHLTDLRERAQTGLGQMPVEGQLLTRLFEVSDLSANLSVFKLES